MKNHISIRFNDQIAERIEQLKSWLNSTQTGIIETAINQLYEIERTRRMNIQALTEAVSRAVAKMETDGIIGWGLETFDNELFEKVEMSPASGCTTSNCAHNSHDPAAPTVKLITRHGEKIVNLGSENESDGYTEWYAVIGDNEPRFFRLNDSQAYWAKLWEIDVNGVPDWALAQLSKN